MLKKLNFLWTSCVDFFQKKKNWNFWMEPDIFFLTLLVKNQCSGISSDYKKNNVFSKNILFSLVTIFLICIFSFISTTPWLKSLFVPGHFKKSRQTAGFFFLEEAAPPPDSCLMSKLNCKILLFICRIFPNLKSGSRVQID